MARNSAHNRDAYIELTFSEDEMEAFAVFHPASGKGAPLTIDYVEKKLAAYDVVFGINYEGLSEAVLILNTEHREIAEIKAAEGQKQIRERPAFIKLAKRLFHAGRVSDKESDQFDYKTVSPYVLVKAREVIGLVAPQRPGKPGISVKGEEIPFSKKPVVLFKPGTNLRVEENKVITLCDGRFQREGDRIWVDEVLELKRGVNYTTGNIKFPGDVIIQGAVQDGFSIFSGASIIAHNTLDVSEVVAKKDVHAPAGLVGRNKSILRAGGLIETKFISHCHIRVKGRLSVVDSIYKSDIYSMDSVILGDRGKIIRSTIFAINGVEAFQIGAQTGASTFICAGRDFIVEGKLEQVNKKLSDLFHKKHKIEEILTSSEEKEDQLIAQLMRIEENITLIEMGRDRLNAALDKNPDAKIIVHNKIVPGVTIEICRTVIKVDKVIRNSCFSLDQKSKKIIVTPL